MGGADEENKTEKRCKEKPQLDPAARLDALIKACAVKGDLHAPHLRVVIFGLLALRQISVSTHLRGEG